VVALLTAAAVSAMLATSAYMARRRTMMRDRYARRRDGRFDDVRIESPLGDAFCLDAIARMPRVPWGAPSAAAFGADPFWRKSLEWMTDRVAGDVGRRLYWVEAWVVHADGRAPLPHGLPGDGALALAIDPEARLAVATTDRPILPVGRAFGARASGPAVVVLLDTQPHCIARPPP
jgi:hypothetical protein